MRLRNFLDFESRDATREEKLSLILEAARQMQDSVNDGRGKQELELVFKDCQAALSSLPTMLSADERWLDRRIERMVRVLKYHESDFIRLNRRYWWVFFAVGLTLVLIAIFSGSPTDLTAF